MNNMAETTATAAATTRKNNNNNNDNNDKYEVKRSIKNKNQHHGEKMEANRK